MNLRENFKHVDLDHFIHRLASVKALLDESHWKLDINIIDFFDFKMKLLCRIQALCQLRYISVPYESNKYECVKYTLMLYMEVKEVVCQMINADKEYSKFASFSFFHTMKEALFRCEVCFMLHLLELHSRSKYVYNKNRNSAFSETNKFSSCKKNLSCLGMTPNRCCGFLNMILKKSLIFLGDSISPQY